MRRTCSVSQKSGLASAFGKEDSYERNPSGVSFVFNHRIFRTFVKVLKMLAQLVKKEFWQAEQYGALLEESSVLLMMAHFHSEQIRSVYADGFSMGKPAIRQAWL